MFKRKVQIEKTLRDYLESKNLSQNKLSKNIGITSSSLHGYLNGAVPRGVETLIKMAQELNLSLDQFVFNQASAQASKQIVISDSDLLGLLGKYELVISKKPEV